MKKLLKTGCSILLALMLVLAGGSAAAEDQDASKEWLELAKNAFVAKDYEASLHYFTLLADAGDMYSQYMVAFQYYLGEGTEQDYGKAAQYALLSTEQGITASQSLLGYLYLNGQGVDQDDAKAGLPS